MLNYPKPLDEQQAQVAEMIAAKAKSMGIPVNLALAMAYQESKFRQTDEKGNLQRSNKGALGIMQVLPDTAREYKFELSDLKDPEKNVDAGLTYLKDLLDKSNGVQEIAVAKYNWGPGRSFFKTGEGEIPAETVKYIDNITGMGGFGPAPAQDKGPPDKQFVDVPAVPKTGETAAEDGKHQEAGAAERSAVPTAKIHDQAATPQQEADYNKLLAAGTGGALGAAYGFAEQRLNAAETRAMREEMARERVRAQYAQNQLPPGEEIGEVRVRPQVGALTESAQTGGTSGEKWSRNWAGRETPGSRSVPESASMYQRGKLQGKSKISQRINKLYPKLSADDPESIWERISKQSDERAMQQRLAEERANQQRLAQIEEDTNRARAARLESERPINRARATLTSIRETPVGEIGARVAETAFKRLPVVGYGVAGASMGRNMAEIDEAMRNKEYIDAVLAASQLAATGASFYPPLAPIAIPASIGLEAVKQARDYYR
jgi:soluble lytic murein transglycosylase-like protein